MKIHVYFYTEVMRKHNYHLTIIIIMIIITILLLLLLLMIIIIMIMIIVITLVIKDTMIPLKMKNVMTLTTYHIRFPHSPPPAVKLTR